MRTREDRRQRDDRVVLVAVVFLDVVDPPRIAFERQVELYARGAGAFELRDNNRLVAALRERSDLELRRGAALAGEERVEIEQADAVRLLPVTRIAREKLRETPAEQFFARRFVPGHQALRDFRAGEVALVGFGDERRRLLRPSPPSRERQCERRPTQPPHVRLQLPPASPLTGRRAGYPKC